MFSKDLLQKFFEIFFSRFLQPIFVKLKRGTFFIFRATIEPKFDPKAGLRTPINYEKKKMNFFHYSRSKIRSKNTPINCEQKKLFFFLHFSFSGLLDQKKTFLCLHLVHARFFFFWFSFVPKFFWAVCFVWIFQKTPCFVLKVWIVFSSFQNKTKAKLTIIFEGKLSFFLVPKKKTSILKRLKRSTFLFLHRM